MVFAFSEPEKFVVVVVGELLGDGDGDGDVDGDGLGAGAGVPMMTATAAAASTRPYWTELPIGALVDSMAARIDDIDRGRAMPQAPINVALLREQHVTWKRELSGKIEPGLPDVSWDQTLAALTALGATT